MRLGLRLVAATAIAGAVVAGISLAPQANADTNAAAGIATPSASPSPAAATASPTIAIAPATISGPVAYTYAGDSITARPDSWLHQLEAEPTADTGVQALHGFAVQGLTSRQVLVGVKASTADVLVIEVGTNDIRFGVPYASLVRNLDAIVAKSGAPKVLLLAIPPSNITDAARTRVDRQLVGATFNDNLKRLATARGWTYGDPFAAFRTADNGYTAGASVEGVHPTTATNVVVAQQMATLIRKAAAGS